MSIKCRIRRMESKKDKNEIQPMIFYSYSDSDGDAGMRAAEECATNRWESENGPVGDREPFFFATCYETATTGLKT